MKLNFNCAIVRNRFRKKIIFAVILFSAYPLTAVQTLDAVYYVGFKKHVEDLRKRSNNAKDFKFQEAIVLSGLRLHWSQLHSVNAKLNLLYAST